MRFSKSKLVSYNWVFSPRFPVSRLLFGVFILFLTASQGHADSTDVAVSSVVDSALSKPAIDTVLYVPPPEKSKAGAVTNPTDLEQQLTQQPTVALFKSLLVPGWGQIGNHRYVKAGFFIAVEGACFVSAIHFDRQLGDAERRFESAQTLLERNDLYTSLDKKRKSRNKWLWYAGIATFVSMFDAYVDAHLSGSPLDKRNDKVNVDMGPDLKGGVRASVSYSF
jgi:hypothetical protein